MISETIDSVIRDLGFIAEQLAADGKDEKSARMLDQLSLELKEAAQTLREDGIPEPFQ